MERARFLARWTLAMVAVVALAACGSTTDDGGGGGGGGGGGTAAGETYCVLATIPEAFAHPTAGYVGLHVMHRRL